MSLARRLHAKLPYFLRKSVTACRAQWRGRKPPFAGVYPSFDSLPVPRRNEGRVAAARAALNARRADRSLIPRLDRNHNLLPVLAAILSAHGDRPLRVLDFGGAAGLDFANLLAACGPDLAATYEVIEVAEVVAAGRDAWSGDNRVTFSTSLPTEGTYDIVFACGGVQYVPSPPDLLRKFCRLRPSAILISWTAVSDRAFVRAQINVPEPVPNWVLGLDEIAAAAAAEGYRLAVKMQSEGDYNVEGYAEAYRVPTTAALLFLPSESQ